MRKSSQGWSMTSVIFNRMCICRFNYDFGSCSSCSAISVAVSPLGAMLFVHTIGAENVAHVYDRGAHDSK